MSSPSEVQPAERRRTPRKKINEIVYMSLSQGNGGIVLDVSEGGLGFHTARPIETGEPISFRFSVERLGSLEVFGKLAWRDGSGKSGGVQFTKLPEALHHQILAWVDHSSLETARARPSPRRDVAVGFPSEEKALTSGKPLLVASRVLVEKKAAIPKTKMFLCGVIAAILLDCFMIVRVQRYAQNQTNEQVAAERNRSVVASRTVFQQVDAGLRGKAELLSTLAAMTPDKDSSIQDSIENPLIDDGSDLIAWADGKNQVSALFTSDRSMTAGTAEAMLVSSLRAEKSADWWFAGGKLYEVALESAHHEPLGHDRTGTIVVGRRIDRKQAQDLADILGSQVAFTSEGKIIESTLNFYGEQELSQQLQSASGSGQVKIDQTRFDVTSMKLTEGAGPPVELLILKSDDATAGALNRGRRLLSQLAEVQTAIVLALTVFGFVALRRKSSVTT
jgi:hypothetical protein